MLNYRNMPASTRQPPIYRVTNLSAGSSELRKKLPALLDELGRVYLETDLGLGLVHTLDVALAAEAVTAAGRLPLSTSTCRPSAVTTPHAKSADTPGTNSTICAPCAARQVAAHCDTNR